MFFNKKEGKNKEILQEQKINKLKLFITKRREKNEKI
jgi:hypothetical protein